MVTGGLEGVGDALTGGIVARQFEPGAGEAHEDGDGGACLNCGAALSGPYCHQCGQPAHVHRSLTAFWHDLAHGVLHFEGKIWRTLPLLAWRPGQLTRRYIEGERARFVSPIALFLFSVFLMFAVFKVVGAPFVATDEKGNPQQAIRIDPSLGDKLTIVQTERAKALAAGQGTASLDLTAAILREQVAAAAAKKGAKGPPNASDKGEDSDGGWLNDAYRKAKENPQLLAYKMESNAYKFSWVLIPVSVPFLWALFLHRRRYRQHKAYDHTVFITYSLSFMTLMLVAFSLLRAAFLPNAAAAFACTIIPPVHIFRQLRGAYALSWFSALWRTVTLLFFAMIALTIFLLLMLVLGVMH